MSLDGPPLAAAPESLGAAAGLALAVVLRPLRQTDLPAVLRLERRAFAASARESRAQWQRRLGVFAHGQLGAFWGERLVAAAGALRTARLPDSPAACRDADSHHDAHPVLVVASLAVAPDWQRRGIASALKRELVERCAGIHTVCGLVIAERWAARQVRAGFRVAWQTAEGAALLQRAHPAA